MTGFGQVIGLMNYIFSGVQSSMRLVLQPR
jgi:hypothetical protein